LLRKAVCCFIGCCEQRETEVTLLARLAELARAVDTDPASIGVLSTGEVCPVALLLGRLDLLDGGNYPLNVLDGLGPRMEKAVRNLHASGWRR
jgi:hypothetical protein